MPENDTKRVTVERSGGAASVQIEVFPGDSATQICMLAAPELGIGIFGDSQLLNSKGQPIADDVFVAVNTGDTLTLLHKGEGGGIGDTSIDIKFDASPKGFVEALQLAVDTVTQTRQRYRQVILTNEAYAAEIQQKEQELHATLADRTQVRQIEAEKAELERRRAEIEYQKALLTVEREKLELQQAQLTFAVSQINQVLQLAEKLADLLQTDTDPQARAALIQTLVPSLLHLSGGTPIQLGLPIILPTGGGSTGADPR